jgi:hypothetical protein
MFDYWKTVQTDVIGYMLAGFNAKDAYIRPDGKIALVTRASYTSPWVNAKVSGTRNCARYQMIYHSVFRFIHSRCLNCWKVVARPRNLTELFEVHQYQKELRRASKSGIETRGFVCGNYGSYWYNDSKEEGLDIKDMVKKDFPNIPVILKRGCTEFEMAYGPSDRWGQTKQAQDLEKFLDATLIEIGWDGTPKKMNSQNSPHYVIEHTKRNWVEFAYDRGDQTYKNYTDGQIITAPILTYEREVETGCQVTNLIQLS